MFVKGIKIEPVYTPQDLRGLFTGGGQEAYTLFTDMEIGIIEDNSSTMSRVPLRIPTKALTNGKSRANRRGTRLTHFLNVIRAFAHDRYNLADNEQVVFIRFTT